MSSPYPPLRIKTEVVKPIPTQAEIERYINSIKPPPKTKSDEEQKAKHRAATKQWRIDNREKVLKYKREWARKARAAKNKKFLARGRKATAKYSKTAKYQLTKKVALMKRHSEWKKAKGIKGVYPKLRF